MVTTILITGTNGKTSICHILKEVFRQAGIPLQSNIHWHDDRTERAADYFAAVEESRAKGEPMVYILEVEESEFAYFAEQLQADFIVLANLSRNQLNLYGELDSLVTNLKRGLELAPEAQAILCADDPLVARTSLWLIRYGREVGSPVIDIVNSRQKPGSVN